MSVKSCEAEFMHAISALRCIFKELTLFVGSKVIAFKMQWNTENAWTNWMLQLGSQLPFKLVEQVSLVLI